MEAVSAVTFFSFLTAAATSYAFTTAYGARAAHALHETLSRWYVLGAVFAAAPLFGAGARPDTWYETIRPQHAPPDRVFGAVWTVLYACIFYAMIRALRTKDHVAVALWLSQYVSNVAWSPVFFGAHAPLAAFILLLLTLRASLLFLACVADNTAASLFAPYCAWLTFAAFLNLEAVSNAWRVESAAAATVATATATFDLGFQ